MGPSLQLAATPDADVALCVDLDGTLLRSDTLYENLFDVLRERPGALLGVAVALGKGKAALKHHLANLVDFDVETLPWRLDLIEELREAHAGGRRLVLVTAAADVIARKVASHLGVFDEVIASSERENLRGESKRDALVDRFGAKGFDYVGDHPVDLKVWISARQAWVVGNQPLAQTVGGMGVTVERVYPSSLHPVGAFLRAPRPYQWIKNILVFVPMLLAHHFTDWGRWMQALAAFAAFSLLASAGYLANDLLDRRNDRLHVRKRNRPFASGDLPLSWAAAIPALFAIGLLLSAALPFPCIGLAALYFVSTIAYSAYFKNRGIADVAVLSCLYTIRMVMGGVATDTPLSAWLLRFSVFLFLTLALAKRVAELRLWEAAGGASSPGRDYNDHKFHRKFTKAYFNANRAIAHKVRRIATLRPIAPYFGR